MDKVKAWVITEPEKIELQEFERPKVAEDGALVKVEAVGVCGSDKHLLAGRGKVNLPLIAGHEFVGRVVEVGAKASETMALIGMDKLEEGDRVIVAPASTTCGKCYFCKHMPHRPQLCANRLVYGFMSCAEPPHLFGAFAEYVYLHPRSWVFKVPDGMPLDKAVLAEPTSIALRGVERAMNPGEPFSGHGYGPGKSAIVYGTGPIGCLAVAHMRYTGAGCIIVTDFVESRLEMAKELGADVTINMSETTLEERLEIIRSHTDGVGPDVALEAAGAPQAFQECLEVVRRGGKLVELGHYTDPGTTEIRPFTVCNKDIDIHGAWSIPPILFKDSLTFFSKTDLPITNIITHHLGFDEVPEAIRMLGKPGVGKVIVNF
jgi:L-iditol 2-dehydrogenase